MSAPSAESSAAFRRALPDDLAALLRLGFAGKSHLLDVAGRCLRPGRENLVPVASDALRTLTADNPLDGGLAAELLASERTSALLEPAARAMLRGLAAHWRRPSDPSPLIDALTARDFQRTAAFLDKAVRHEPGNLFWREQALTVGAVENVPDFVFRLLEADGPEDARPALRNAVERVHELFSPREAPSAESLLEAARLAPWNTNLALRAHDAVSGAAEARAPLPGRAAILLYSWNKADELEATLRSLLASDLSGASVFVLDNGSTDSTGAILESMKERFAAILGAGKFTIISLPVNIGAAAARNWLLSLEAVRANEFICYLDDDVELPADWLQRLGAAVSRYPEAGVWGCKVVDHANPLCIQSADSHLRLDPAERADLTRLAPNPFGLTDLHIQTLDTGAFDFMRPCASVTGCCHLFRTGALLDSGGFAIQLSPSQYDDMEHDLRLCEARRFPVYQGHLAVRHKKRTGSASHTSRQEMGNALGNKYKMQTMHTRADIAAAMEAEQTLLEADLLRKLEYLDSF